MTHYRQYLKRYSCFFYGLLLPLSFAPFHMPGFAMIALALLYLKLSTLDENHPRLYGFWQGLAFGVGFFGLGTSWVYVSIHQYGHLNPFLSAVITLFFILYLSLFCAGVGFFYQFLRLKPYTLLSILSFAALWTFSEYSRATFLTGFPWLLIGTGQIDTPLRNLLPFFGVYGVTFCTALASGFLVLAFKTGSIQRIVSLLALFVLILSPEFLTLSKTAVANPKTLTVGVVQSNISMRDKWDEKVFWRLFEQYQSTIENLLGTDLIVLPESALPVPAGYIPDLLKGWSQTAKRAGSALLVGIPQETEFDDTVFYNGLLGLGRAQGKYLKEHLVPFGEYYPKPFRALAERLNLPEANMQAGGNRQKLVTVQGIPIATLICYESAYADLLRKQIPQAQLIVALSDDGWFGHSLALYQHQQMAQVQSLQTDRYQVLANNDGLSSVIDEHGYLKAALLPFTRGVLRARLELRTTLTPWVRWGDTPSLISMGFILAFVSVRRLKKGLTDDPPLLSGSRGAILTNQIKTND